MPTPGHPTHGRRTKDGKSWGDPTRNIRVSDQLWDAAQTKAKRRKTTVSEVVRSALTDYVAKP